MTAIDGIRTSFFNKTLNGQDNDGEFLPLVGGVMSGVIDCGSNKTINQTDGVAGQDSATVAQLTSGLGNYLPLVGGTMSGPINMGGSGITNGAVGVNPTDFALVSQLGGGAFLPLAGGTMTGAINGNSNLIMGTVAVPESSVVASGLASTNPTQVGAHIGADAGLNTGVLSTCGTALGGGVIDHYETGLANRIGYDPGGAVDPNLYIQTRDSTGLGLLEWLKGNGNVTIPLSALQDQGGYTWHAPAPEQYGLLREPGPWAAPFPQLRLAFGTGIKHCVASLNAIGFYFDGDGSTTPDAKLVNGAAYGFTTVQCTVAASGGFVGATRNIFSVTRTAVGTYDITFANAMPTVDYVCSVCICDFVNPTPLVLIPVITNRTTTVCTVKIGLPANVTTLTDSDFMFIAHSIV